LPVLFGVSVLVFLMIRIVPGDIVDLMIGPELYVGAEYRAEMRAKYGLDQPIYIQYANWAGQIVQGNFGMSLRNDEPVLGTILRRFPITAELAILSVLLSALVAVPLGVVSAVKRNSATDFVVRLIAMLGLSVPNFWLAAMLLLVTGVVFMPVHVPPHKQAEDDPGPEHRVAMCRLASEGEELLRVCTLEVERAASAVDADRRAHARTRGEP